MNIDTVASEPAPKNRRTVVKTLRLPEELLFALQKEAEEEGTTLNSLCSVILGRHSEWGSKARKLGIISMPRKQFLSVLEAGEDDRLISSVKEELPTTWLDMAKFWFGEASLDAIIRLLTLESKYGWKTEMSVKQNGNECLLIFYHGLGAKFSMIMGNAIDELLRTAFHIHPNVESGEALFTVRFSVPKSEILA